MNVLIVGGGAREHAMCDTLHRSKNVTIFTIMHNKNPGIAQMSKDVLIEKETDVKTIVDYALDHEIDMTLIGPEAPLQIGLTDALQQKGIMVCAPTKNAARIETDKEWMRDLLKKYEISGQIRYESFTTIQKAIRFIDDLNGEVALKPIGLTGGKGVKVSGDHFKNQDEAELYIKEIFKNKIGGQSKVLIEEKIIGEEFTLQALSDGSSILPFPAVQDHKRLQPDDKGPNTGGMGSYSRKDGLLPFLSKSDYEEAASVLQDIIEALGQESCPYVGPIYGQFILTAEGSKIIEINARFGDPEAMNVLPLLQSDYAEICSAMINGTINEKKLNILQKSTVCKYVVPKGYGYKSMVDEKITVDEDHIKNTGARLFYASVNKKEGYVTTTSSRSLAVVGIASSISEAEQVAERALKGIQSENIYIRHDIGTNVLINKRVQHMKELRGM
ncbi:MAG: phosphoribosylamine--glycine ligase [Candidatus Thermoplasmatota archaeon]|nr:phosphoribosylamine--glycine ligase [Candidatus Thermoplasmatota archaeon]